MGGSGSTRWNSYSKKYTVEDALILRMKAIHSSLGTFRSGAPEWSRNGQNAAGIGYRVTTDEQGPVAVQLHYVSNGTEFNCLVELNTTPLPWGGRRYWFTCPDSMCGRRVANLYLPPGAVYFACRTCHRLTYRSSQRKGKPGDLSRRIAARMQNICPGITARDVAALLEDKTTDHLHQCLLEATVQRLKSLPDPHKHYLSGEELCKQSGLSRARLAELSQAHLLLPDHKDRFRPKLVGWARKLNYLLEQGWQVTEIKRWASGRFLTKNPRRWPPQRSHWRI